LAAKYGIMVLNAPGIIDQDFTGEIKVILFNSGKEDFIVKKGDRIAQLVFSQVFQAIFQKSEEMPETVRGDGGFGSTGR
jgi:dUTP pyrophosphatase